MYAVSVTLFDELSVLDRLVHSFMPLNTDRIKALCFDVDGTLRDTDDQMVETWSRWLRPIAALVPGRDAQGIARRLVMLLESPATYLFGVSDRLGFDHILVMIGDMLQVIGLRGEDKGGPLIDGAGETIARLHQRFPMSVVSNRGRRTTIKFLTQHNLERYFQCIVTGQTCRRNKPHPEPLVWAASQMGVTPEECLMIGDTTVDMLAALASGAQAVGLLCGFGELDELLENGADLILENPGELVELLLGSNNPTLS